MPSQLHARVHHTPALVGRLLPGRERIFRLRRCRRRRRVRFRNPYVHLCRARCGQQAYRCLDTWSRFLVKQVTTGPDDSTDYNWRKLNIFTIWHRTTRRTTVLVFDPPPSIVDTLPRLLLDNTSDVDARDPFWMYIPLVDEVIRLQHPAVWGIRNLVRTTEESRSSGDRPTPDYRRLHDLARHAIHVSETLELATNTIDAILAHHGRVVSLLAAGADLQGTGASVGNRLLFYRDMLRSLSLRSASNRNRLQNEIGLAFNTVAQYDARISLDIGRAAQADGAAMRTIAFVTLVFLPATFVCAIFSMSFFDYDASSGSWLVSPDFWRYWAVAVPVTVCTATLWLAWTSLFPPMPIGSTRPKRGSSLRTVLHIQKGRGLLGLSA